MDIAGKRVTIIGAQKSGVAAAHLAVKHGAIVFVSEHAGEEKISSDFRAWMKKTGVAVEYGGHTKVMIEESDLLVVSPGVPNTAPPLMWAREKGIMVLGEIEFAAQFCRCPIIAVTGSNGKTTVSTLTHLVLTEAGYRSRLGGNIGNPFSSYVDESGQCDYMVLEVSSFQMEMLVDPQVRTVRTPRGSLSIRGFKPFIAVLLNFSENHLDRHADLADYFCAKTRIFSNQDPGDYAVLNAQDTWVSSLAAKLAARARFFNDEHVSVVTNPNFRAVATVAQIVGIAPDVCQKVFASFPGVEHRLEFVRTVSGVDFINDSKATTAEAGQWALARMSKPVIMICGGRDKHIDFSPVRSAVQKKVKKMIVIGEAQEKLHTTFADVVPVVRASSFADAVTSAYQAAQPGECVLLSPMCASFDMFQNFEQRGKVFKELVQALA